MDLPLTVGFTGTQEGMTEAQFRAVSQLLAMITAEHPGSTARHGDCIGADAQFHSLAQQHNFRTIAHPGHDKHGASPKRAFCAADIVLDVKPYHVRNLDMVKASDVYIATPQTAEPRLYSGTWSTVRKCVKHTVRCSVVRPDGGIVMAEALPTLL